MQGAFHIVHQQGLQLEVHVIAPQKHHRAVVAGWESRPFPRQRQVSLWAAFSGTAASSTLKTCWGLYPPSAVMALSCSGHSSPWPGSEQLFILKRGSRWCSLNLMNHPLGGAELLRVLAPPLAVSRRTSSWPCAGWRRCSGHAPLALVVQSHVQQPLHDGAAVVGQRDGGSAVMPSTGSPGTCLDRLCCRDGGHGRDGQAQGLGDLTQPLPALESPQHAQFHVQGDGSALPFGGRRGLGGRGPFTRHLSCRASGNFVPPCTSGS